MEQSGCANILTVTALVGWEPETAFMLPSGIPGFAALLLEGGSRKLQEPRYRFGRVRRCSAIGPGLVRHVRELKLMGRHKEPVILKAVLKPLLDALLLALCQSSHLRKNQGEFEGILLMGGFEAEFVPLSVRTLGRESLADRAGRCHAIFPGQRNTHQNH